MWTALIPLKGYGKRKTRLAGRLSAEQRARLTTAMFDHLVSVLKACPEVGEILLLTDDLHQRWTGRTIFDRGLGLNAELGRCAAALAGRPLMVIHPDLPHVSAEDVGALLAAARGGWAIAPDRHERGTNAVAFAQVGDFAFQFGPESFHLHLDLFRGPGSVVRRYGLALDIDTPADLVAATGLCPALADDSPFDARALPANLETWL